MTLFKFTNSKNKIIHITSCSPKNMVIEEEGTWSEMLEEEQELFAQQTNEEAQLNPLPVVLEPEVLSPQQKLEAIGLTVNDLKQLLDL